MPTKNITAFVIAGGKSTRFGQDKLLYKLDGMPILERVTSILKKIFGRIIIIGDVSEKFGYLGFESHPDLIRGVGPIAGIYTALTISETEKNFCFAGDLPFLNADLIEYMISVSDNYDITVPVVKSYFEALHTIYSKNCLEYIKATVTEGNNKIIKIFEKSSLMKIEESAIIKFADPALVFKNINYIEDLK
ncbi:MAG: molybdenum cofactor guanylyltransferase [Spirochaetota bacterium]